MKIGIVISTSDPETVWNAFRFGNVSLKASHKVSIFLMNRGVEIEDISNDKYDVKGQISEFAKSKGIMLACGTCLKSRDRHGSDICSISTMNDLLKLVEDSDKILTFG